ncbi:MAG: hypothetical protein NVSMB3_00620 [Acidobacteriaceae bacterium]
MFVRSVALGLSLCSLLSLAPSALSAQDDPHSRRGRKYKAPADTSHIEVIVVKKSNGKPVPNAAVVFHPIDKEGKDQGNMEVKTDPEGKASLDVIPTGSNLRVQVIANGYATFAGEYQIVEPSRQISVSLLRPQEQVSAYEDNSGKISNRKPGVQEPVKPDTQKQPATPPKPTPQPPSNTTAPSTGTPRS